MSNIYVSSPGPDAAGADDRAEQRHELRVVDDLGLHPVVTPQHSAPNRFIPGFLAYSVAVVLKWPSGRAAAVASRAANSRGPNL